MIDNDGQRIRTWTMKGIEERIQQAELKIFEKQKQRILEVQNRFNVPDLIGSSKCKYESYAEFVADLIR